MYLNVRVVVQPNVVLAVPKRHAVRDREHAEDRRLDLGQPLVERAERGGVPRERENMAPHAGVGELMAKPEVQRQYRR